MTSGKPRVGMLKKLWRNVTQDRHHATARQSMVMGSSVLLGVLLDLVGLMELRRQPLAGLLAQRLLDEFARVPARRTGKASGLHGGFALGTDDDLDDSAHAAPHYVDCQLDGTVAQFGFGDGVALTTSFRCGAFDGIRLQELIELFLLAPMASVVVVFELAGVRVADHRIPPAREVHAEASGATTEELERTIDGAGSPRRLQAAPTAAASFTCVLILTTWLQVGSPLWCGRRGSTRNERAHGPKGVTPIGRWAQGGLRDDGYKLSFGPQDYDAFGSEIQVFCGAMRVVRCVPTRCSDRLPGTRTKCPG